MRIAVMGAGGVGGYFGARLAHAGHDVAFVARGRHLLAMKERGLSVKSALGDLRLARPVVTDDPATLGWFDVVLFAVKLWDTESAAAAIKPLLAAGGVVIPFQNGVESIERIGAVVGEAQVMGGVAYIAAKIAEPGVIAHTGTMARLRFGAVAFGAAAGGRSVARRLQGRGHRRRDRRRHPPGVVDEVRVPVGAVGHDRRDAAADRRDTRRSGYARDVRGGDARGMVGGARARHRAA